MTFVNVKAQCASDRFTVQTTYTVTAFNGGMAIICSSLTTPICPPMELYVYAYHLL